MNRVLTIGSFLLWYLICQTASLFAMQDHACGVVCPCEKREVLLTEVVNSAFQEKISDGKQFLETTFEKFNQVKTISSENVNLLFHNGKLYINRFFPVHQKYDGVKISDKTYDSLQVANVLGFDKSKIIAIQLIKENVNELKNAVLNNYYSVKKVWDKISRDKQLTVEGIKKIIDGECTKCPARFAWLKPYYASLCRFSCEALTLNCDIFGKGFTIETLNEIYSCAQNVCRDYADRIAEYISYFDSIDGNKFRQSLAGEDILLKMQQACIHYKKYAHTEYILDYHLLNISPDIKSVQFVSFYDMCGNCENLWAKVACEEMPVSVVSCSKYLDSRNKSRESGNSNLTLIYK